MVNVLDCGLEVNKLKLQLCYYINFQTDNFGKDMNFIIPPPPSYGLNSITAVLLQGWFWY